MILPDSVFDLGAPASSRGDVFIRVRPFDNLTAPTPDEGFTATLFNEPLQPESIRLVRDPEALWLSSFLPADGDVNSVAVNEPLLFRFSMQPVRRLTRATRRAKAAPLPSIASAVSSIGPPRSATCTSRGSMWKLLP